MINRSKPIAMQINPRIAVTKHMTRRAITGPGVDKNSELALRVLRRATGFAQTHFFALNFTRIAGNESQPCASAGLSDSSYCIKARVSP